MNAALRCTLVTGGSSGIGRALATRLVTAGHRVHNLDVKKPEDATDFQSRCVDLRCADEVESAVREIGAADGYLTGIAAVAGKAFTDAIEDLDPAAFRHQVEANLDLTFITIRTALPLLREGASIVTVSSTSANGGDESASCAYAAAKAGLVGLTRSLAMTLAGRRIRVNCVVPGAVDTPLLHAVSTPTERRLLASVIPFRRFAAPTDVAEAIYFLLDDQSRYITGQTIVVDGGLSLAYKAYT